MDVTHLFSGWKWKAVCLAAIVVASAIPARAADIHLRPTSTVSGTLVKLGDVADIASNDVRETNALAEVVLGPAPAAGNSQRLDLSTIRNHLAARGVNMATTTITGSNQTLVTSAGGIVQTSAFTVERPVNERTQFTQQQRAEKLVSEAIRSYLGRVEPKLGRYTIAVQIERDDIPLLIAGAGNGYQVAGGQAPWDQPQQFRLRTLDRNNAVREVNVMARLAPHPYVLGMRHMVPKGQIIQAGDLAWRQSDNLEGAFTKAQDLIGRETNRALRENEVVRQDDVRTVPLVRSNEIVTVVARVAGVEVKRAMKARSDGAAGETVTLTTLDGKQTLVARVTGFHEAETIGAETGATANVQDQSGRIQFIPRPAKSFNQ